MLPDMLIQSGLFLLLLLLVTKPMGHYLVAVLQDGDRPWLRRLRPLEHGLYRLAGVDAGAGMGWRQYALALLLFNALGIIAVLGLQLLQGLLPFNPEHMPAPSLDLALNTAVSFVTNTNWQAYSGEASMSYLTQMLALTVQNFLSAATGIAVVIALIRGFTRHSASDIGNFWTDLVRGTLYLLLPLSVLLAVVLMGQGVIQNLSPYQQATTLQPTQVQQASLDADGKPLLNASGAALQSHQSLTTQTLPMGPVASQEAIKMLGTNGGGFFNANSAHPYENPTPLTNLLQMLAIFLIPAGLCYAFGMMVGDRRQGWAVFAAMALLFVLMAGVEIWAEQAGNPLLSAAGADQLASSWQSGGNMEGKETRFGIVASALFATVTTAASCGAVNAMHDSLTPLGGLVPMWLMQLGEVVFGGVGSGLYTMLVYAILAVFVAGLMIGRTPEYLGKKIEAFDMKMTALVILVTPLLVLAGTALALMLPAGQAGVANPAAHGYSEILYALSSAANNNGSAFAGLSANTPFYNGLLALAMLLGRFGIIVPVLAIAGSLAAKKRIAAGVGTMPTHGPLFVVLLIGAVVLVGALTYVPALALGPVIEQLQMTGR